MQRSSGFMKPFETRVGVQRTRSSLSRIADVAVVGGGEALGVDPPADLAHLLAELPLAHQRSVAAAMVVASSIRSSVSVVDRFESVASNVDLVDQARAVGVDGVLVLPNGLAASRPSLRPIRAPGPAPGRRRRSLPRRASGEPSSSASSGIGRAITNRPPLQARVDPRERDPADDFGDPHRHASSVVEPLGHARRPARRKRRRRAASSRRSTFPPARPRAGSPPGAGPPGATASGSAAVAARTPATWHARQTATDASSVTTRAPRPSPSDHPVAPRVQRRLELDPRLRRRAAPAGTPPPVPTPSASIAKPHSPACSTRRSSPAPTEPDRDPPPLQQVAGQRRDDRPGRDPDLARRRRQRLGMPRARTAARRRPRVRDPVRAVESRSHRRIAGTDATAASTSAIAPGQSEPCSTVGHRHAYRRHRSGSPITLQRPGRRPAELLLEGQAVVRHQHHVPPPRPQPVEHQHRLAIRPAVGRLELDDQQPLPLERRVLDRRRRRADHPAELHGSCRPCMRMISVQLCSNRVIRRTASRPRSPSAAGGRR